MTFTVHSGGTISLLVFLTDHLNQIAYILDYIHVHKMTILFLTKFS